MVAHCCGGVDLAVGVFYLFCGNFFLLLFDGESASSLITAEGYVCVRVCVRAHVQPSQGDLQ